MTVIRFSHTSCLQCTDPSDSHLPFYPVVAGQWGGEGDGYPSSQLKPWMRGQYSVLLPEKLEKLTPKVFVFFKFKFPSIQLQYKDAER